MSQPVTFFIPARWSLANGKQEAKMLQGSKGGLEDPSNGNRKSVPGANKGSFLAVGGIWGRGGGPEGTRMFLPGFWTLKVLAAEESSG